jgi:hypothetical protein
VLGQRTFEPANADLGEGVERIDGAGLVETPMAIDIERARGPDRVAHSPCAGKPVRDAGNSAGRNAIERCDLERAEAVCALAANPSGVRVRVRRLMLA